MGGPNLSWVWGRLGQGGRVFWPIWVGPLGGPWWVGLPFSNCGLPMGWPIWDWYFQKKVLDASAWLMGVGIPWNLDSEPNVPWLLTLVSFMYCMGWPLPDLCQCGVVDTGCHFSKWKPVKQSLDQRRLSLEPVEPDLIRLQAAPGIQSCLDLTRWQLSVSSESLNWY
jgi:hypothetical protein